MSDLNKDVKERVKITDIQGNTFLCVAAFCIFLYFTFKLGEHHPGEPMFFAILFVVMPFFLSLVVGWFASKVVCLILIYIKYKEADREHD